MKGDRGERKIVEIVEDDLGCYAQRTGASGGATSRNRPDVIACVPYPDVASRVSSVFFIEVKSRDNGLVRFKKEEVADLVEASERGGANALLVTKPDLRKHDHCHCFFPGELKENEKSYSVVERMIPGRSLASILTDR